MQKKQTIKQLTRDKNKQLVPVEDVIQPIDIIPKLLEELFDFRLIEKIARPIQKKLKEQYIAKYFVIFNNLHSHMYQMRNQRIQTTYSETTNLKNKSAACQATTKPENYSKVVKTIETRYREILMEGSFKYFQKIVEHLKIEHPKMSLINIGDWADACLNQKGIQLCC